MYTTLSPWKISGVPTLNYIKATSFCRPNVILETNHRHGNEAIFAQAFILTHFHDSNKLCMELRKIISLSTVYRVQ